MQVTVSYLDLNDVITARVQACIDATDNRGLDDIRNTPTGTTEIDQQIICDIQRAISWLVWKAPQLIGTKFCKVTVNETILHYTVGNFTTNLAESWMHIRSKFDGGKQINRSQAGSWEGWCAGAGLHCNEGAGWGPTLWAKVVDTEPSDIFKLSAANAIKLTDKDRKRKVKPAAKLQRKRARYSTAAVDNSLTARMAYSR